MRKKQNITELVRFANSDVPAKPGGSEKDQQEALLRKIGLIKDKSAGNSPQILSEQEQIDELFGLGKPKKPQGYAACGSYKQWSSEWKTCMARVQKRKMDVGAGKLTHAVENINDGLERLIALVSGGRDETE